MKKYFSAIFVSLVFFLGLQGVASANSGYEAILKQQVNSEGPGLAVIVQQGGKTIYSGAHGMANMELGVALTDKSIFRLGSITKQFTAAAIMMLQEQGKLSIDDNIHKYVPDFPTDGHTVTLAHLMSHTSGINNYTNNEHTMEQLIQAPIAIDEMLKKFAEEPMVFKTGESMQYSNTGYVLLGKVIEVVSGQSYAQFIEEKIFKKLGMKNSQYGGRQIIANRAAGYTPTEKGFQNASLIDMSWPHAAGSLLSTVGDLAIWNQALVTGKVVSTESYQKMITPFKLNDGSESPYGFGLSTYRINKYDAIGHAGGIPGFSTNAVYLPEKDLYIAVLSNNDSQNPAVPTLLMAAEYLDVELPQFSPIKVSEEKLKKMMGTYKVDDNSARVLSMEDGKVFTQRDGGHKWEVIPMSDNSFYYDGSLTYFVIEEESGNLVMNFYSNLSDKPVKAFRGSDN